MATTRFGHLDDFTLKNSKVGIGTSTPTEALEVIGGSRSKNIEVTGITTLTSYEGFQNKKTSYVDNIHVDSGESGTLSGEVVIGSGTTLSVGTGARKPEGVSNSTRACFAGGNQEPSGRITTIQSVNFSSDGIAESFGDLAVAREAGNSNSDSHGGLGGY